LKNLEIFRWSHFVKSNPKPKRIHNIRIYSGSICLFLYFLISCFNLTLPIFFRKNLFHNFTSVIANVIIAAVFVALCIPSKHLCLNPPGVCGVINHLGPIKLAVAGTFTLLPLYLIGVYISLFYNSFLFSFFRYLWKSPYSKSFRFKIHLLLFTSSNSHRTMCWINVRYIHCIL